MLQCYNKGCGQKFDPSTNNSDACQYHPGQPIFHDAKKKWSCCKKFSTDFSEFLSIKGCTKGEHSNVLPVETKDPKSDVSEPKVLSPPAPVPPPPITAPKARPSNTEPLKSLKVEITPNFKSPSDETVENKASLEEKNGVISVGTSCKNSGCKVTYTGTPADGELCMYHPGVPIFHEGMKYWTCCNRKTTEFDAFMEQVGCSTGRHNWTEKAARDTNLALTVAPSSTCRHDWFQLPATVIISMYAKDVFPRSLVAEANQIQLNVSFDFGRERLRFSKQFNLFGTIDPSESVVKLRQTKVEIVLKKADSFSWPRLEFSPPAAVGDTTADSA